MSSPVPSNHHHCHLPLTSLLLLIPNFQILARLLTLSLKCTSALPSWHVFWCSCQRLGKQHCSSFSLPFSSLLLVSDSAHLLAITVCSLARYTTYLQPTVQSPQVSGGKGGIGYINWYKYWIKRGSLIRLTAGTQNAFWHKAWQRWKQHSASLVLKIIPSATEDCMRHTEWCGLTRIKTLLSSTQPATGTLPDPVGHS